MTLNYYHGKSYQRAMALYNLWLEMERGPKMTYDPHDAKYFVRCYA